MKSTRRWAIGIVVAAVVFGAAAAVLKGGDAGVRDSIGNISAPWLLLPFFAGVIAGDWRRGALLGLAACLAALSAFYVAEAFVLDLGGHPVLTNLALTLGAGRIYFVAGVISGPLMGALGGSRIGRTPPAVAAIVGATLVGEPLAVFAWLAREGIDPAYTGMVTAYPALWMGEMALGVILAAGVLALNASRVRAS